MGQVEDLMKGIKAEIERSVRYKMTVLGRQLLERALYYREVLVRNNIGHNYTGNLVNSICVGVYFGRDYQRGYFGTSEGRVTKLPTMQQMTTRKGGEPRRYVFGEKNPDYMGGQSSYKANVKTDATKFDAAMAADFLKGLQPSDTSGYTLILAYPVTYAQWIEKERASTGMALVEDEFTSKKQQIARWFVEDIAVDNGNSNLMLDTWAKNLYEQWGGDTREERTGETFDVEGASLYYRDISYGPKYEMTITAADNKASDTPFGASTDEVPF